MPYASHSAMVAMAWSYMFWLGAKLPSARCWLVRYFRPPSTFLTYLPAPVSFAPPLWVWPAARNGSRARPVPAIGLLWLPSISQLPLARCILASHISPLVTHASDAVLPPPSV